MEFALHEAQAKQAELLVLFVRHIAVPRMGAAPTGDAASDTEAQQLFGEVKQRADELGVSAYFLYSMAYDVAEAILEMAVTHSVDYVLLGATQRGGLWRTMKGDVIQEVAEYLPERINLLIHG
jgi:nucleotide-binding universal stress UspA family protein